MFDGHRFVGFLGSRLCRTGAGAPDDPVPLGGLYSCRHADICWNCWWLSCKPVFTLLTAVFIGAALEAEH